MSDNPSTSPAPDPVPESILGKTPDLHPAKRPDTPTPQELVKDGHDTDPEPAPQAAVLAHARSFTRKRARVFLEKLAECGCVSMAAAEAGIGRRQCYQLREQDQAFRELWDEALEIATDFLEHEARRRAVDGVLEPVVSKGEVVTHVRKYSDKLLEVLLRAHRPDKFNERLSGAGDGPGGDTIIFNVHGVTLPPSSQAGREEEGRPLTIEADYSEEPGTDPAPEPPKPEETPENE